uniref:SfiI-subtelomeric related protein family member n=1 Tax=Theileria annulata TaxID=5874 RepID=A0A3B0MNZ2_THEAN
MNFLNINLIILSFVIIRFNKFVTSNQTINIRRYRGIRLNPDEKGQYKVKLLFPNRRRIITSVTDGTNIVYKSEPPELVECVFVMYLYGAERLLNIVVGDGDDSRFVHCAYIGGAWIEVDDDTYMSMKEILRTERKLDIAEVFDKDTFNIDKHSLYGLPAYIIHPKDNLKLVAVYDNYHLIWQHEHPGHNAAFVIVHGELTTTKLVNVIVNGTQQSINQYFMKEDDEWKEINKSRFYLELNALDMEVIMSQAAI